MNIIEDYKKALNNIYDHVGFKEDWIIYPIDDKTDMFWKIDNFTNSVLYGKEKVDVLEETGNHYEADIYTQRFYSKHVYRGEKYTMIFLDPHVDGMKWFGIFDNDKEL